MNNSEFQCKLYYDEARELYMTACEAQYPPDVNPEDQAYRYCPYCGDKIKWAGIINENN